MNRQPASFVNVNGQRLHFRDSGGEGPAIVFSHGLLMDQEMFDPQVAFLAGRYRTIVWDERCHGDTVTSPEPFSYWDSAADLVGLLDHVGIERAVLAGMSQGGFLSQRAAIRYPDRVAGLFLIATQAGPEEPEKVESYRRMLDWVERDGVDALLAEATATIILGEGWEGAGPWMAKWMERPARLWRQAFETLIGREDLSPRLAEISAPAAAVHGDSDLAIPVAKAEALCAGIAGCVGLTVVPGGGHAVNLTHPDPVNRVLDEFLYGLKIGSAWA